VRMRLCPAFKSSLQVKPASQASLSCDRAVADEAARARISSF
jgi:hypothetical protein